MWRNTRMKNFKLKTEAATRGVLWKKLFLEILQNSQENTCARDSFLIKWQAKAFLIDHLRTRTEHNNHLPKRHHDCNLQCIWLQVILQKYLKVDFSVGSMLQMLKANDFDRDGCRTFIVQFPCGKMNFFLFARIISEKNASRP